MALDRIDLRRHVGRAISGYLSCIWGFPLPRSFSQASAKTRAQTWFSSNLKTRRNKQGSHNKDPDEYSFKFDTCNEYQLVMATWHYVKTWQHGNNSSTDTIMEPKYLHKPLSSQSWHSYNTLQHCIGTSNTKVKHMRHFHVPDIKRLSW